MCGNLIPCHPANLITPIGQPYIFSPIDPFCHSMDAMIGWRCVALGPCVYSAYEIERGGRGETGYEINPPFPFSSLSHNTAGAGDCHLES
jgi:hypothetical protein